MLYKDLITETQNRLDECLTAMEVLAYIPDIPDYQEQVALAKVLTITGDAVLVCTRSITAMAIILHKLKCIQDQQLH